MRIKHFCLAIATALIVASPTLAAESNSAKAASEPAKSDSKAESKPAKAESKAKSSSTKKAKPADAPGWVVVEEDWFFPLRFESVAALNNARYHYRRSEEKAAANEIDKAVSWLKYAEGHALAKTKAKLSAAEKELTALSKDLNSGNTIKAADLDKSLAQASNALAQWHYYKAKEHYGKEEAGYAAQDLEAAAAHLQNAADSAHFEYGPDTVTIFDDVFEDGKLISHHKKIDHNRLGMHLQSVEKAVQEMDESLKK